jgi:hypothetical protein
MSGLPGGAAEEQKHGKWAKSTQIEKGEYRPAGHTSKKIILVLLGRRKCHIRKEKEGYGLPMTPTVKDLLASNIISNYYLIFLHRNVILSKKKNGNIISGCRENNQSI